MANCPHCDYTTSSQGDEGSQEQLKEHLLSRHSDKLRRNKDPHKDIEQVATVMAKKSTSRSRS